MFIFFQDKLIIEQVKHFSLYFVDQSAAIYNSGQRSLVVACGSRGPYGGLGPDDVGQQEEEDETSENGEATVSETYQLGAKFKHKWLLNILTQREMFHFSLMTQTGMMWVTVEVVEASRRT